MAKFLDTTEVSAHVSRLIKRADKSLILISPYLQINDRIRELLTDRDRFKLDIRLIYRENNLERAWR